MRPRSWLLGSLGVALCAPLALARTPLAMKWGGTLTGTGDHKITGTIAVVPAGDGKATATVRFTGDAPGVTRPWHVHVGSCAKGGGVLGGAANYTPITVDGSGAGSSTANLPVAAPDSGSYYVNIHESAANMRSIVACGDLTMQH